MPLIVRLMVTMISNHDRPEVEHDNWQTSVMWNIFDSCLLSLIVSLSGTRYAEGFLERFVKVVHSIPT